MRGERKDRERNSGWERVRTRRERRESNKERELERVNVCILPATREDINKATLE